MRCCGLLLVGLLALTGCSCPDYDVASPPEFTLGFSTDTLASGSVGFRRVEVRSAYLVRYVSPDLRQPLDTLRQLPAGVVTRPKLEIYYSSQGPPVVVLREHRASPTVSVRSFRLAVPAANRQFDITSLVREQGTSGGRCPYPITIRNEATVNGQRRDALQQVPELTK